MRVRIRIVSSLLLVALALGGRSVALAEEPSPRLGRPADTEAAAVLLNLLARHAEGAVGKSALDRCLDEVAKTVPESRNVAAQIVASYRSGPLADRQRAFGRFAEISSRPLPEKQYVQALQRLAAGDRQTGTVLKSEPQEAPLDQSKLGPKDLNTEEKEDRDSAAERTAAGSTSRQRSSAIYLDYTGLYCREETDWDQGSWSDEIYIITAVVEYPNRSISIQKHPGNRNYYTGVDSGDTRRGPQRTCWRGAQHELCLISVVMEQDDRNSRSHQRYTQIVRTIVSLCTALEPFGAGPVEQTAPAWLRQILEPLESLPNQDDLIAAVGYRLSSGVLRLYASRPEAVSHGIPFDFITRHRGDGADFRVYFRARYR